VAVAVAAENEDVGEAFFLPDEALLLSPFGILDSESNPESLASAVVGGCISAPSADCDGCASDAVVAAVAAAAAAAEEEALALLRGLERLERRGDTALLLLLLLLLVLADVDDDDDEEEGVVPAIASPFSSSSIASVFFSSVMSEDDDDDDDDDGDDSRTVVFSSAGSQSRTGICPLKSLLLLACLESCSRPLGLASAALGLQSRGSSGCAKKSKSSTHGVAHTGQVAAADDNDNDDDDDDNDDNEAPSAAGVERALIASEMDSARCTSLTSRGTMVAKTQRWLPLGSALE
jgi:hypothetical protein